MVRGMKTDLLREIADQVEDLELEYQSTLDGLHKQVGIVSELNDVITELKVELKQATDRIEYYESIYPDLITAVQIKARMEGV